MALSTELVLKTGGPGSIVDGTFAYHAVSSTATPIGQSIAVPSSGVYSFSAVLVCSGTPNGSAVVVSVLVNGTSVTTSSNSTDFGSFNDLTTSYVGYFNAGDQISITVSGSTYGSPRVQTASVVLTELTNLKKYNVSQSGGPYTLSRDVYYPIFSYTPEVSGSSLLRIDYRVASTTSMGLHIRENGVTKALVPLSMSVKRDILVNLTAGVTLTLEALSTTFSSNSWLIYSWDIRLL